MLTEGKRRKGDQNDKPSSKRPDVKTKPQKQMTELMMDDIKELTEWLDIQHRESVSIEEWLGRKPIAVEKAIMVDLNESLKDD